MIRTTTRMPSSSSMAVQPLRLVVVSAVAAVLLASLSSPSYSVAAASNVITVELPPLPYGYSSLKPFITKQTLEYHHDKHHAKYVATTNAILKEKYASRSGLDTLESVMQMAHDSQDTALYNNAAQSWNHAFYWNCMKPPAKKPSERGPSQGSLTMKTILKSFENSYERFATEFANAANAVFGSGWCWLAYDAVRNELVVLPAAGAVNPMQMSVSRRHDYRPVLVCDVWEHAYYLDYQNRRPDYVQTFLEKLVNWDFVESNLRSAMGMNDSSSKTEL